ncbi:MAG: MaoC family dehydratase [Alphaproteobacteria bacterium]|nr:MaoC family dehydratase [Alphaproteobacteria bacterium]
MDEVAQLFAEDFRVGDRFEGAANPVTERAFEVFAEVTGDAHPIHYDEAYAKAHGYEKPVAHGLLTMAMTALGAAALARQLNASMIAFLSQGAEFRRPVFVGDTLRSEFEVNSVALQPERGRGRVGFEVRLYNQHDELVLDGHHLYLLRSRDRAHSRSKA